jgi:molybdopterin molybdotransferase
MTTRPEPSETPANAPRAALSVPEAQRLIEQLITPVGESAVVVLTEGLGRTLAIDIVSSIDVPAHDNSALDGYALRGADLATTGPTTLTVTGSAVAGRPHEGYVASGSCVRITTGAVLPSPCDTVVARERAHLDGAVVVLDANQAPGQNCRKRGEDLARGQLALAAGRRLTPADLGLLASLGVGEIPVFRRPRVAFFSTGDELRAIGEPLDAGDVYDSNRYTLFGMLKNLGVEAIDLGLVRDDQDSLRRTLEHACGTVDAIITSGGVSEGERDFTRAVLQAMGELSFLKIAMKPGRPMAMGRLHSGAQSAYFFGLPGNPVAVMVTFYVLVRDALLRLGGARPEPLALITARSETAIRKSPGRTDYLRAIAYATPEGWRVRTTGAQGSGILSSMSAANCLIVLGHERADVAADEIVEALPLYGLL